MFKKGNQYTYSPSDLNAFLDNECVTWFDRHHLDFPGEIQCDAPEELHTALQQSGDKHEERTLESFRAAGDVVTIDRSSKTLGALQTLAAMREGRQVIYQARLAVEPFAGYADFLVRVPGQSDLGSYHYQVHDTKLARSIKPYFPVQLCCYSEMLAVLQGRMPEEAGIILGNNARVSSRISDYIYYYRAIRDAFLKQQREFDPAARPRVFGRADYRHWQGYVDAHLTATDDLSRVANIRGSQIEKLTKAGITTMRSLAETGIASVHGLSADTFDKLRGQARLQIASDNLPLKFELLRPKLGRGLGILPPASPNDIAFDIEGYPIVEKGLEYLLGVTCLENGELTFKDWWAHDSVQERCSFQQFVDWAYARWRADPTMHIYHYAAYEKSALLRLARRYASREAEVDDLVRNGVLVDLYKVVNQSMLIGAPSYSLKKVEHLYLPKRAAEVSNASDSIVSYFQWLTDPDGADWQTSTKLREIRDYNEEDCNSTWKLIEWLRVRQAEAGHAYIAPMPANGPKEETVARAELAKLMLAQVPADRSSNPEHWRVFELLAHLIEFVRREQKSIYYRKFERLEMTEQQLQDDADCLGAIERTATLPVPVKRSFLYEFSYPRQETKLKAGDDCELTGEKSMKVKIESLDRERRLLTIKRSSALPDRFSLIPDEIIPPEPIVSSIEATVQRYASDGVLQPALEDFLHRRRPRMHGSPSGPLLRPGEDVLSGLKRIVFQMNCTTLCIQGPPGSGKTTRCAQVIAELLKAGKRVGISSNSHNAICHLMAAAAEAAAKQDVSFTAAKCGGSMEAFHPRVEMLTDKAALFKRDEWPGLVGGTAWLFSHEDAAGKFDYLFVDEAGQVCTAYLVAMARSASNLIVMGDQMQLPQPVQGVHPGESGLSILDYYLQTHATAPADLGVFLPTSWRMRPEICSFISSAFYEGCLQHEPITEGRRILLSKETEHLGRSSGLVFIPVKHEERVYECEEEVAVIQRLVADLVGQTFEQPGKSTRPLTQKDILVVAPYNLQVRRLRSALPSLRVGTVDKFQGQEAPVVILSMTASEGDSAPRGLDFLFDRNRLNVAISRAQVLAIVVGNPRLTLTRCSRPEQMQLVNIFCRAAEIGDVEQVRIGSLVA